MSVKTFRDPHVSRWQSIVDEVLHRQSEPPAPAGQRPTLDHPVVSAAAAAGASAVAAGAAGGSFASAAPPDPACTTHQECAHLALRIATAKIEHRPAEEIAELESELRFGTCDPLWSEAVAAYVHFFDFDKGSVPYRPSTGLGDPAPHVLSENATVALIADWGTGTAEAIALLEKVAAHKPDVLIHLGDVYYSGTASENERYFLDPINQIFGRGPDRPLPVFNLPGNHDMYSGGAGYYSTLDRLNLPSFAPEGQVQSHSFFCLQSSGWQILGLNTGLHDDDLFDVATSMTYLEDAELAWAKDKINNSAGRRTILLSHHQLFSAFSPIGPANNGDRSMNTRLLAQFADVLPEIDAWLWGHEHNLEIYGPYAGLSRGRCIGHAAVPVLTDQVPYASRVGDKIPLMPNNENPVQLGITDDMYNHGYVIAKFDDAKKTARLSYYQDTGKAELLFEEVVGG
ncbi:MAG: metallophosphoesterase [Acidobacteriota bacterium]